MCLLKCQTAFLMMKIKKFKSVIKCFYYQNGFKSLPWKEGRIHSRAPLMSTISMNRLKKWIKLTENWNELKKNVWNDWKNNVILFQRKQWFKTQFFIKIIVSEFLKVWLLSFSDSPTMSHLVIIKNETEQKVKLSFTITDLLCIITLIVTSLTA